MKGFLAWLSNTTQSERIGMVGTAAWSLVALVSSIERAYHIPKGSRRGPEVFHMAEFFMNFLSYGVFPIVIAWGIYWITLRK